MSYILTAIYDAGDSNSALDYAAALAVETGASLRIIYPYNVPVALGDMPMPLMPVEEVRDAAGSRIAAAEKSLQSKFPGLRISAEAVYGMLGDLLEDECERETPLFTVIGNDEEGEEAGSWIGGASGDILREGSGPVLAVPANAAFARPQRVCLACDARSIKDGIPTGALQRIQAALGFRITVLHVRGAEEEISFASSPLEAGLAGLDVSYEEIPGEGAVDEAIAAFAESHGMDWLVLAPHHYGFWEGLFHKSHTSQVLRLAHVPVLALHA